MNEPGVTHSKNGNGILKLSKLDKAIGFFSPKTLNSRIRERAKTELFSNMLGYASNYSGAWANASMTNRALADFIPPFLDPNQEYDKVSKMNLTARSKYADNNFAIARSVVDTNVVNVVGPGLRLQSNINNDFLGISEEEAYQKQREIEFKFNIWAENPVECSLRGDYNFYQQQSISFRGSFVAGDHFLNTIFYRRKNGIFSLKMQPIAAQRVYNSNNAPNEPNRLVDGIEFSQDGLISWYHVANKYLTLNPIGDSRSTKWQRIPIYGEITGQKRISHINCTRTQDQARGEPYIANCLREILQLDTYLKNESIAMIIQSCFTILLESVSGDVMLDELETSPQETSTPQAVEPDVSATNKEIKMAPGLILSLAEGQRPHFANPTRPNQHFEQAVNMFCAMVGSATGLPMELILLRFQSSYSAARAALMEAWKRFLMLRKNFEYQYCQFLYNLWLFDAVLIGILDLPGFLDDPFAREAWSQATWDGYRLQNVQELQAASAAAERIRNNISSISKESAILGNDVDTIARQKKYEKWLGLEVKEASPNPQIQKAAAIDDSETEENTEVEEEIDEQDNDSQND